MERMNKRVVMIRTGIVLAKDGGALSALIDPLRFHIAPVFGNGKQFYSFLVTITEHGGTFGNVDLSQISGKDIHEAIGFLVARQESDQIKPFKEER